MNIVFTSLNFFRRPSNFQSGNEYSNNYRNPRKSLNLVHSNKYNYGATQNRRRYSNVLSTPSTSQCMLKTTTLRNSTSEHDFTNTVETAANKEIVIFKPSKNLCKSLEISIRGRRKHSAKDSVYNQQRINVAFIDDFQV